MTHQLQQNVLTSDDRAAKLHALRAKLNGAGGPEYWQSLNELAETPEFRDFIEKEFPLKADWPWDDVSRRNFMKVMGASMALAGLAACARQPNEHIVPYVKQPEEIIPGEPLYFATAHTLDGYAVGVLAESHEGRPTKLEGTPDHPSNLGAINPYTQASVLSLYDPDRSKTITYLGKISTWDRFVDALRSAVSSSRPNQGRGVYILTETVTSPTLKAQIDALLDQYPNAKWIQYDGAPRDNVREGARLAFGEVVETRYHFDEAGVVVSLDSDFLVEGPGHQRYARDFAARRIPPHVEGAHHGIHGEEDEEAHGAEAEHDESHNGDGDWTLNRLYAVECTATVTGAVADHRMGVTPSRVERFTRALAHKLGVVGIETAGDEDFSDWVDAIAEDLQDHRGKGIIIAGVQQPPVVHALAHAMNRILGNVNETVEYTAPVEANPQNQLEELQGLVADMNAGNVETLLIFDANPVYTAPADLDFATAFENVPTRMHVGLYADETGGRSHWHVPAAHYLEAWGDARAHDGTVSIIQPLIQPLFNGKSPHEVMSAMLNEAPRTGREIVMAHWRTRRNTGDFDRFWRKSLSDGVVEGAAFPPKSNMRLVADFASMPPAAEDESDGLEIAFRPDPTIYDGRFANNGWLQELPKPHTKLTWDNAVILGPATAVDLGFVNDDVVELSVGDRSVRGTVLVSPAQPPNAVTVHLGYGRERAGKVGNGLGFNANLLRTAAAPWANKGATLTGANDHYNLAITEEHHPLDNRLADRTAFQKGVVRQGTVAEYKENHDLFHQGHHAPAYDDTLYDPEYREYDGYAWGMTIDLNQCIGCNACAVACQAENNIPVVGRDQVIAGREMNWIRIDRYYSGDFDNLDTHFQPVPCMQCETAPCEVVCPVGATQHSVEGLNDMVYNRCIGTRYCANNCPYKVRRFNFYHYAGYDYNKSETLNLQKNPDVTVRGRGVMEKCTYCVQRINAARIEAKKEDRQIRDGEITTACQQACPTKAIQFGNINDAQSNVTKLKNDARNYALIADLNTRPRTTYLARLRNPNPKLVPAEAATGARTTVDQQDEQA